MNESATRRWVWTCSHCGETNTLVANAVPETAEVGCSRCGRRLGLWRDVKAELPEKMAGE